MNNYIKYNPIRLMLIFVVPALTSFSTVFILFFPIALVSNYTVYSLFSTALGLVFWIVLWLTFQVWIFTPNFKKWLISLVGKIWLRLWFFINKEKNNKKPLYFSNGKIKEETDKEGNNKHYYENGDLKSISYKNGNSKEFLTGSILYREFKDGITTNYDLDGKLEEKSWRDTFEGEITEAYYSSGKLKWRENKFGRKEYYENGQLISQWKSVLISYNPDGRLKHGEYNKYTNIFQKPFELNGVIHEDYIIEKSIFNNGLLHGTQKTWYDVGVLESEIQYKNGVQHGFERNYNEKGQLIGMTNYKNGNLFGLSRTWFDNGVMENEYSHGDDSFPERQWYENGQLFSEKINNIKKYWDESGNEIEDPYKNINTKNN